MAENNVFFLRTRRDQRADRMLGAVEDLRDATDGIEVLAAEAVRQAVAKGLPPERIEAIRQAAHLVTMAGDVLVSSLDEVTEVDLGSEAPATTG